MTTEKAMATIAPYLPHYVGGSLLDEAVKFLLARQYEGVIESAIESDDELPGMWSRDDFTGGDPDERSYVERERAQERAEPAANCRQRLMREGKPYPRSGCVVCGKWAPKSEHCDSLLDAEKTAPAAERDVASGDSGRPWLPMASAPRDGRVVELRWDEDGIAPGWWTGDIALPFEYEPSDEYLWRFIDARSSESGEYFLNTARDNEYGPTHWRPYAPPAAERAKVPDVLPDNVAQETGEFYESYVALNPGCLKRDAMQHAWDNVLKHRLSTTPESNS